MIPNFLLVSIRTWYMRLLRLELKIYLLRNRGRTLSSPKELTSLFCRMERLGSYDPKSGQSIPLTSAILMGKGMHNLLNQLSESSPSTQKADNSSYPFGIRALTVENLGSDAFRVRLDIGSPSGEEDLTSLTFSDLQTLLHTYRMTSIFLTGYKPISPI